MTSKQPPNNQLSMFSLLEDDNDKPHPLMIADKHGMDLPYIDTDGNPSHYLYHASRWTEILGADNHNVWLRAKKQIVRSTNILLESIPYASSDGKEYIVDFISQEGCYLVAQTMRVTKKRQRLIETLEYLRKAGVIVDEIRRNPEQLAEWATARLEGITVRKTATQLYTETHVNSHPNIGVLTNTTYHLLFRTRKQETAKKELVKTLGLTPTQAANFRDNLHMMALTAIKSAETLAGEKMRLAGHKLDDNEQMEIVRNAARMEAESYLKKCEWLGIDAVTGKPLGSGQ